MGSKYWVYWFMLLQFWGISLGLQYFNGSLNSSQAKSSSRFCPLPESSVKQGLIAPVIDARQLLIGKARLKIQKNLAGMRSTADTDAKKRKTLTKVVNSSEKAKASGASFQLELKRGASMAITVPHPDFYDFDKDRSEPCFKPKQIWALYDEEAGMSCLHCPIHEVISANPFKIHIGYLSSKTDTERGSHAQGIRIAELHQDDSWIEKVQRLKTVESMMVTRIGTMDQERLTKRGRNLGVASLKLCLFPKLVCLVLFSV